MLRAAALGGTGVQHLEARGPWRQLFSIKHLHQAPAVLRSQICAENRVISLARSRCLPSLLQTDQLAWLTRAGDKQALQAGWLGCV